MRRLVGITGEAGAGKDTLADCLLEYGFKRMRFSYWLKQMLAALPDMEIEKWDERDWRYKVHDIINDTPRHMAQTLGTEWGRTLIHPDLWIRLTADAMSKMTKNNEHDSFVISDVRFENEASFIRRNGLLVHIYRENSDVRKADFPNHSSEDGVKIDKMDFIIHNHGSIINLESYAKIINNIIAEYNATPNKS